MLFLISFGLAATLDFFKSPESLVRSGQVEESILTAGMTGQKARGFIKVQRGKESFSISGGDLLRARDLCPKLSPSQRTIANQNPGYEVARDIDCYAYVIVDTSIRRGPGLDFPVKRQILSKSLVRIKEVQERWTKLGDSDNDWVNSQHLILARDFANYVWINDKAWIAVQHRYDVQNYDTDKIQMHLDSQLAIVLKTQDKSPLEFLNRVRILGDSAEMWNISILPRHGKVFWRPQVQESSQYETHSGLARMGITQLVRHPSNPLSAMAVAKGIYRTWDGKRWYKERFFDNQMLPINLDSQGRFLIGPYRETANGYEAIVKWENLAKLLGGHIPRLTVKSIESSKPGHYELKVFTGLKQLTLVSQSDGLSWSVQK